MEEMNGDPRLASEEALDKALDLLAEIEGAREKCDYERVRRGQQRLRARRRRIRTAIRASAAAVAVMAVAGGVWLYSGGWKNGDIAARVGNIPPPSEHIILSVADGARIRMDTLSGSVAVAGGGSVVRDADGSVDYRWEGGGDEIISNTLEVPRGATFDIRLPDGTHVWLNADSRLTFPSSFAAGERRVQLEGEAWMKVTADASRPFIVEGGGQTVTVLGTEFNISAYPGEPDTRTTLLEGSVRVDAAGGVAMLAPGQQSVLGVSSGSLAVNDVDPAEAVTWRDGMISIEKQTIDRIVANLSRLYDVRFTVADDKVRNIAFRGSIPRYATLIEVLEVLEEISPVRFDARGETIRVRHR